jgi:hypothetical protein
LQGAALYSVAPRSKTPHDHAWTRPTPRRHSGRPCRAGGHGAAQSAAAPRRLARQKRVISMNLF